MENDEKKFTKEKLEEARRKIQKKYGKETISLLSGSDARFKVEKWPIGLPDFDAMLEGGLPKGRICQIWGPDSAGKTSLALRIAAAAQYAHYIDLEGMLDNVRPVSMGVNPKRFEISRPETGEEACEIVLELVRASIPLVVIDSLPGLVPNKILDNEFGKNDYALTARLLGQQLYPRLVPALNHSNTTVIWINQVREKIGILFGDPLDFPGGRAHKHFLALNLQIGRKQWHGPKNDRIGLLASIRVVKTKVCNPYRECELNLSFAEGFVDHKRMRELDKIRRLNEKGKKKDEDV